MMGLSIQKWNILPWLTGNVSLSAHTFGIDWSCIKIHDGLSSSLSSKNNKQLQAWQAWFPFNLVLMPTLPDFWKFGEIYFSRLRCQSQISRIWELWAHCSRRASMGWWLLRLTVKILAILRVTLYIILWVVTRNFGGDIIFFFTTNC